MPVPQPKTSTPHKLDVGSVEVIQKTEGDKKNPNSLRFLIGHLINIKYGGNLTRATQELQAFGGRYSDSRGDRPAKQLNEKNISKILRDEIHIEYWHVEIFSRSIGVPSGIFLIISREISYHRYRMQADNIPVFHNCLRRYLSRVAELSVLTATDASQGFAALLDAATESFRLLRDQDSDTRMLF